MDAFDVDYGISGKSMEDINLKNAMINSADRVVALFDSSKFGKKDYSKVCDVSAVDTVITDKMNDEDIQKLEEMGIEVIIARK